MDNQNPDQNGGFMPQEEYKRPEEMGQEAQGAPDRQIDVTYHEGEPAQVDVGTAGNEDQQPLPDEGDEPSPADDPNSTFNNVDKAWDVAHAGKPERDEAADWRKKANETKELVKEIEDVKHTAPSTDAEKTEHEARSDNIRYKINNEADPEDRPYLTQFMEQKAEDPDTLPKEQVEMGITINERAAVHMDAEAETAESWAEILHDHPVSDEYKQTHQSIKFDARSLRSWEVTSSQNIQNVKKLEEALADPPALVGIDGLGDSYLREVGGGYYGDLSPYNVMKEAYGLTPGAYEKEKEKGGEFSDHELDPESRQKLEQFLSMINSRETTLGQLADLYIEAFKKAYIDPIRQNAEDIQAMLDDVRSGRASGTPENSDQN